MPCGVTWAFFTGRSLTSTEAANVLCAKDGTKELTFCPPSEKTNKFSNQGSETAGVRDQMVGFLLPSPACHGRSTWG